MKDDLKEIRRNNLRYIIDEYFEGVDSKFAEVLGKQPNQLSRVFSQDPKTQRNIGNHFARELEAKAGLPKSWLDVPHGKTTRHQQEGLPQVRKIPFYNLDDFTQYDDVYAAVSQIKKSGESVFTLADCSEDAFAIKIISDAMGDCFPMNTVVVFDPNTAPSNRSFVLVKPHVGQKLIFRELLFDGSYKYLKALNSDYPIIELTDEGRVFGVCVDIKLKH